MHKASVKVMVAILGAVDMVQAPFAGMADMEAGEESGNGDAAWRLGTACNIAG